MLFKRNLNIHLKKYHDIINNFGQINTPKLQQLNTCIAYYNKFIDRYLPITKNSTLEFILTSLLYNNDVILLHYCSI
jgi:hypothetical protein